MKTLNYRSQTGDPRKDPELKKLYSTNKFVRRIKEGKSWLYIFKII